jgi:uncharacterized protein DUF1963
MWSPEKVREVASAHLPHECVERALAAVCPAWRLEVAATDHPDVRIGGPALLADGEDWPHNARGVPLTFIAEIDTDRLPPLPEAWPHDDQIPASSGILRIFGDLVDNPYSPAPALVWPRGAGAARRVAAPPTPDPWLTGGPADDALPEHRRSALPEHAASAVPFLTVPERRPGAPADDDRDWLIFSSLVRGERSIEWLMDRMSDGPAPWNLSHILGEPVSVQDDVRLAATDLYDDLTEPSQWRVLLALHDSAELSLSIFDGGAYHVLMPAEDLRNARWHRAVLDIASQ